MTGDAQFVSAIPILASRDIPRSVEFFCTKLGFTSLFVEAGAYAVIVRGNVSLHFRACADRYISENTSCRIRVHGIDKLYAECWAAKIVHPRALLESKPWDAREFSVVDPDGNLVTFAEYA
jgi:catechol 2,3-dioxygenase-like lactoylglutathione lyase family enzyme